MRLLFTALLCKSPVIHHRLFLDGKLQLLLFHQLFLNTKVNANGKSSPAKVVSVSSSNSLIPPSADPKTSSTKPSKVPLISPTQGPSGRLSPIVGERNTLQSIRVHNCRVSNEKLWTSWSKFEQRRERNANPAGEAGFSLRF